MKTFIEQCIEMRDALNSVIDAFEQSPETFTGTRLLHEPRATRTRLLTRRPYTRRAGSAPVGRPPKMGTKTRLNFGGGVKWTPEMRKKMSERMKKLWKDNPEKFANTGKGQKT